MITPPVPWIGVKTMRRSLAALHQRGIEHQSLQPLHVGVVDFAAERGHVRRLGGGHADVVDSVGVHLRDDAAGVRLDDLRAVVEINFVAVVVRRVVAGGDDDARARPQIAHGKRQLRRRARPVEEESIAAILRRHFARRAR